MQLTLKLIDLVPKTGRNHNLNSLVQDINDLCIIDAFLLSSIQNELFQYKAVFYEMAYEAVTEVVESEIEFFSR